MKHIPIALFVAAVLAGCGRGNPLLEIPEGQFKNLFMADSVVSSVLGIKEPSCLEKIHFPDRVKPDYLARHDMKVDRGPAEQQVNKCLDRIQQAAASPSIGIKDNITYDHIRDPRVKDRAITLGVLKQ
ncbi:MAG: hypothetical protein M0Q22_06625 [Sulfuritalea sp.]|nr:hypothetical protein [Sulfuritalea sp.]